MRILGIVHALAGAVACVIAGFVGFIAMSGTADVTGQNPGLGAIAFALGAVGIIGAGAVILRNSRPNGNPANRYVSALVRLGPHWSAKSVPVHPALFRLIPPDSN